MPVAAIAATALLWSGAIAGFGGAVEVTGVSYALYQNLSPGYGFTAIAVALATTVNPFLNRMISPPFFIVDTLSRLPG